MSTTIRDIITEGLSRANIVSRKQQAPEPMVQTAFRLLKGVAAKFSNDNLLQFLRRSITFVPTDDVVVIGENEGENTVDVVAENLQEVKAVYLNGEPMDFVSFEDLPNSSYGNMVYSWQPITDKFGMLYFKNGFADREREVQVIYNVKWDFDVNSVLHVPEKYVELFNLALAYKLAANFPRLGAEQLTVLKNELDEMISNVRTTTVANKYISRDDVNHGMSYQSFAHGEFL